MTGWRLGWLTHPAGAGTGSFGEVIANLIEYNTSGAQPFLQHAGIAALTEGEPFVAAMVERCRAGRAVIGRRLAVLPRVRYPPPEAAFYAFFAVPGVASSQLGRPPCREKGGQYV